MGTEPEDCDDRSNRATNCATARHNYPLQIFNDNFHLAHANPILQKRYNLLSCGYHSMLLIMNKFCSQTN